jgi:hypothetical protein
MNTPQDIEGDECPAQSHGNQHHPECLETAAIHVILKLLIKTAMTTNIFANLSPLSHSGAQSPHKHHPPAQ